MHIIPISRKLAMNTQTVIAENVTIWNASIRMTVGGDDMGMFIPWEMYWSGVPGRKQYKKARYKRALFRYGFRGGYE